MPSLWWPHENLRLFVWQVGPIRLDEGLREVHRVHFKVKGRGDRHQETSDGAPRYRCESVCEIVPLLHLVAHDNQSNLKRFDLACDCVLLDLVVKTAPKHMLTLLVGQVLELVLLEAASAEQTFHLFDTGSRPERREARVGESTSMVLQVRFKYIHVIKVVHVCDSVA